MMVERPRSERGAVLIHVGVAMIGLLGFCALSVDYGVMWTARRQAQNSADAAALAGAVSLAAIAAGYRVNTSNEMSARAALVAQLEGRARLGRGPRARGRRIRGGLEALAVDHRVAERSALSPGVRGCGFRGLRPAAAPFDSRGKAGSLRQSSTEDQKIRRPRSLARSAARAIRRGRRFAAHTAGIGSRHEPRQPKPSARVSIRSDRDVGRRSRPPRRVESA